LNFYLKAWSESQEKPIVLFIDEIDALLDDVLVSILRQLRDGCQSRPGYFPSSVVLVGLRDVRDYKEKIRSEVESWGTASPFNVKSDSLFLNNFSREEVDELLEQHTRATGQVFPEEVKKEIFYLTGGQPWFVKKDGALDIEKALKEFQEYYRRNSGAWLERYEYKESAHHLLLMAFLQRIVNSGGEIIREMAVGNGRIDMLVKYKNQEFALELKVKRDKYTIEDGKKQLARYLDGLGLNRGYLVIFDPAGIEWEEKIYWKEILHNGKTIIMVGL
jgi:hypothetical protein